MGAVWDLDLPATDKFVLLAFADHADHNGENARPGIALVAKKCSLSERQVQVSISKLKAAGYMVPHANEAGGRSNATSFRICFPKGAATAPITTIKGAATAPITTIKGAARSLKGAARSLKGADDAGSPYRNGRAEPSGTVIEPAAATREAAAAFSPSDSEQDIPRGIDADAVPLTLAVFEGLQFLKGYTAFCRQFPNDAAEFAQELAARAMTENPIRSPERYFRERIIETLSGDRDPAAPPPTRQPKASDTSAPRRPSSDESEWLAMRQRASHETTSTAAYAAGETIQ